MYTEMALTARKFALTLAVTGIATMGSIALAPAASAAAPVAQDGPNSIIEGVGNGPDEFMLTEHGRKPVFFCDDEKSNQRHQNCIHLVPVGGSRF